MPIKKGKGLDGDGEINMKNKATFSQKICAKFLSSGEEENEKLLAERKKKLFAEINGEILEIGPGLGVNLKYYPRKIKWLGIEPNPEMHSLLLDRTKKFGIKARILAVNSENLKLKKNTFDFVISTHTLCSVSDLEKTLSEIKRG